MYQRSTGREGLVAVVDGLNATRNDWFVARTQPHREQWAAENVARQGAIYYFPRVLESVRVIQRGVRKKEFRARPLFPCYLFVFHPDGQWHFLLNTFGVVAVVMQGERPGIAPGVAVEGLRAKEQNGMVVLPKEIMPTTSFSHNQSVRITKGSFSGHIGIVQGNSPTERVQVLLDLLGRKTSFIVRESELEAA